MDKFDRIDQMPAILRDRHTPIGREALMECIGGRSRPAFFRSLAILRDVPGALLEYAEERGG